MAQKPSIPAGTRDFGPDEMIKRTYIFDTIRGVFRTHGFLPLETPAMENLSTLLGKYGEEGDKLLFKILNSGDFMSDFEEIDFSALEWYKKLTENAKEITKNTKPEQFIDVSQKYLKYFQELSAKTSSESFKPYEPIKWSSFFAPHISEKGLRYDLTVPFARYVVQHRGEITFPFRRYQIQPVWRADRPQKGRYREFYQCDVDIIGSRSLLNEVELVQIVEKVFSALKINVLLKVNNRKILYGIAETIGHADRMVDLTVAIDKLEKIGIDKVNEELAEKGIAPAAIQKLQPILALSGSNREKLAQLSDVLKGSETGRRGIAEVTEILSYTEALGVKLEIELDLSLARGLNYYTGAIFEVKAKDYAIGSICGGGRYDDLTGIFGMPDTSGVGISFGADRIYDVLTGLDLYPKDAMQSTRVLFINFGGEAELASLQLISELRGQGIPCEIYPDAGKMKKQLEYANRRGIPFVVLIGENEVVTKTAAVKNMVTGEQREVSFNKLLSEL